MSTTTVYYQPHYELADNIISHSISAERMKTVYASFYNGNAANILRTQYFLQDLVYTIEQNEIKLEVVFPVHTSRHGQSDVECVKQNRYTLAINRFPMQMKYDHERQSVICRMVSDNYILELEALIHGIKSVQDRKCLLNTHFLTLIEDSENVFSLSYRLFFKKSVTDQERIKMVELL